MDLLFDGSRSLGGIKAGFWLCGARVLTTCLGPLASCLHELCAVLLRSSAEGKIKEFDIYMYTRCTPGRRTPGKCTPGRYVIISLRDARLGDAHLKDARLEDARPEDSRLEDVRLVDARL